MRIGSVLFLYVMSFPSCFLFDDSTSFKVTQSGLHYHFHEKNEGLRPQVGDEIHYNMTIRRGARAIKSDDRKEVMPLSPKKNPILQAFKIMGLGDSVTIAVFVDSLPHLMSRQFEAGDTMFVDLKITDIRQKQEVEEEFNAMLEKADFIRNNVRQHIRNLISGDLGCNKTASGLRYVLEKEGNGKAWNNSNRASLHYAVYLPDGRELESTFRKGTPKSFDFEAHKAQAVPGFLEGLSLLKGGSSATFIIPPNLAYGEEGRGPIPAATDLIIYVELVEVY